MTSNLKTIRKEKGISAMAMAKLLGLKTSAAYYKKESGSVNITIEEAKKIAAFFNMPLDEIFLNQ